MGSPANPEEAVRLAEAQGAQVETASRAEATTVARAEAYSEAWYLIQGLHESFFFMEERRQLRRARGRWVAYGLCYSFMGVVVFLGFALYGLAALRTHIFGKPQRDVGFLLLPSLVTFTTLVYTVRRCRHDRDNVAMLWANAWIVLLLVWELWLWPDNGRGYFRQEVWMTEEEKVVMAVFMSLEAVTLIIWFLIAKVVPFSVNYCHTKFALKYFWMIRPIEPAPATEADAEAPRNTEPSEVRRQYNYRPYGLLSCTKRSFSYIGKQDTQALCPHRVGVWEDNSYHGEVLKCRWEEGLPTVPFISRCFGSGSILQGWPIGYGTKRLEAEQGLSSLYWERTQMENFIFGTCGVECSAAGAFLAHLPQLFRPDQEQKKDTAEGMVRSLQDALKTLSSWQVQPDGGEGDFTASMTGSAVGEGAESSRSRSSSARDDIGKRALVFVHGYNCPIDWACMRLGQLMTLGNFGNSVLPLVFSWPTGKIPTFFHVRRELQDFAPGLVDFLRHLKAAQIEEIHLMAHSMGCELVATAMGLPAMKQLQRDHCGEKRLIKTISFCNPSCKLEGFEFHDSRDLSNIMELCDHLALYCDREDFALWALEIVGGEKVLGNLTDPIPKVKSPEQLRQQHGEQVRHEREQRAVTVELSHIPRPGQTAEETQPMAGAGATGGGRSSNAVASSGLRRTGTAESAEIELVKALRKRIDVVDCTSMDTNVNGMRHGYFDLNTNVVGDLKELIVLGPETRVASRERPGMAGMGRLMKVPHTDNLSNVFSFLAPPAFVTY